MFRVLEASALAKRVKAVQSGRPQVIALGGGALMSDENFELIANHGVIVWLDAPFELIEKTSGGGVASSAGARSRKAARVVRHRARRDTRSPIFASRLRKKKRWRRSRRILELPLFYDPQHHDARKHALQIFRAALAAADPQEAVLRHLKFDGRTIIAGRRKYPLKQFDRIQVIGAGKASAAMARAVERLLGQPHRRADGSMSRTGTPRICGGFTNRSAAILFPMSAA